MSVQFNVFSGVLPEDVTTLVLEFFAENRERDLARVAATNKWMSELSGRFRHRIYQDLEGLAKVLFPTQAEQKLLCAFLQKCESIRDKKTKGIDHRLGVIFIEHFPSSGRNRLVKHVQDSLFLRRSLLYYFEQLLVKDSENIYQIFALWNDYRPLVTDEQESTHFDFKLGDAFYRKALQHYSQVDWNNPLDKDLAEITKDLRVACELFARLKEFDPKQTSVNMLPNMFKMSMRVRDFKHALIIATSISHKEQFRVIESLLSPLIRMLCLNHCPDAALRLARKVEGFEQKSHLLGMIVHYFHEQGKHRQALEVSDEQRKCRREGSNVFKLWVAGPIRR